MAFSISMQLGGGGYWGLSAGFLSLNVHHNNKVYLYTKACQGTSGCGIIIDPFRVENSIAGKGETMLCNLNLYKVQIDIPTMFVGYGTIDFTLQVFDNLSSEPIFKVNRKPDAWGGSAGNVTILTQLGSSAVSDWDKMEDARRALTVERQMRMR